jgi:hypothetical protein
VLASLAPGKLCYGKTMSHTLVLEIPDEAYQGLVRSASEKGKSPEKIAVEILADTLGDPVLNLAGCLTFHSPDIAARHDEYIGAGILATAGEQ